MRLLLILALLGACAPAAPDLPPEPLETPTPERVLLPPPPRPAPAPIPEDVPEAHEFDPEALGDLTPLLPGRWQLVPDGRKLREYERAKALLARRPDQAQAAQIVAALETVMSMELVVQGGRLRFTMPAAQAAHPYTVVRDRDPELDVELQGPKGQTEALHFVFEARDRLVLERGRESLTFERR
jgi:hypothetical protein